jgi:hypothetical protein
MDVLITVLDLEVHCLRPQPGHPQVPDTGDLQVDEDTQGECGEQQAAVGEDQKALRLGTLGLEPEFSSHGQHVELDRLRWVEPETICHLA